MLGGAVQITQWGSASTIITLAAASASAAIPLDSAGLTPKYIRLASTSSCYVRVGKGAQTAVIGDMMMNIGAPTILQINAQWDTIAAIWVTAAGILQISPVENS